MYEGSKTIAEWCAFRKFSRSKFYQIKNAGKIRVSYSDGATGKPTITGEADEEYLQLIKREAASAEAAAKAVERSARAARASKGVAADAAA
jgi:hypothetical protein